MFTLTLPLFYDDVTRRRSLYSRYLAELIEVRTALLAKAVGA